MPCAPAWQRVSLPCIFFPHGKDHLVRTLSTTGPTKKHDLAPISIRPPRTRTPPQLAPPKPLTRRSSRTPLQPPRYAAPLPPATIAATSHRRPCLACCCRRPSSRNRASPQPTQRRRPPPRLSLLPARSAIGELDHPRAQVWPVLSLSLFCKFAC